MLLSLKAGCLYIEVAFYRRFDCTYFRNVSASNKIVQTQIDAGNLRYTILKQHWSSQSYHLEDTVIIIFNFVSCNYKFANDVFHTQSAAVRTIKSRYRNTKNKI